MPGSTASTPRPSRGITNSIGASRGWCHGKTRPSRLSRGGYSVEQVLLDGDPAYADFIEVLRNRTSFIEELPTVNDIAIFVLYPRGLLIRKDENAPVKDDSLLIEEEEVQRAGPIVKRSFQYARRSDGRTLLWLGRSKTAGRGEAASGLRFDVVEARRVG